MKKSMLPVLLLGVAVALSGCGAKKPADTVEAVFESLQENNLDAAREYFYVEEDSTEEETGETDEMDTATNALVDMMEDFAEEHAAEISYNITDSEIDGDEAIVNVEVTYTDASAVTKLAYQDFLEQAISSALANVFTDTEDEMSESEFAAIFTKSFENAQEKASFVSATDEIEIPCQKVDGKWMITDTTDLMNIYYGNIIGTMDSLTTDDADEESNLESTEEDALPNDTSDLNDTTSTYADAQDYRALDYAGSYSGWFGTEISFSAYTTIPEEGELGIEVGNVIIYYDGVETEHNVYVCNNPGDWEDWDYDRLLIMYDEEGNTDGYLGFYEEDGTIMMDYNGVSHNIDTLEMVAHYES